MATKPTYKEVLTLAAATTINIKDDKLDLTQNSLIIITAAGTIYGTYVSENVEKSLSNDATFLIYKNIGSSARKLTDDTPSSILLKDATMIASSGIHNSFKYLYVFIQDIIAVSFGNISQN